MTNSELEIICYILDKLGDLQKKVKELTLDDDMIQKNIEYHQAETDRLLKLVSRE